MTTITHLDYLDHCRVYCHVPYDEVAYPLNLSEEYFHKEFSVDSSKGFYTITKILNESSVFSEWDEQGLMAETWSDIITSVFPAEGTWLEFVAISSDEDMGDLEKREALLNGVVKTPVTSSFRFHSSGFGTWVEQFSLLDEDGVKQNEIYHLHLSAEGGFQATLVLVKHSQVRL